MHKWQPSANGQPYKPDLDLDVTENVIGTYGLLTIDGPFDAIALSGSSEAFKAETMI